MSRIKTVDPNTAKGEAKELLETVKASMGRTPNIIKTMANSPAILKGFIDFSGALNEGGLSQELREQIALAVAEANRCDYCLDAHSAIAKMKGLSDEQILDGRRGTSKDAKENEAIRFALELVENKGFVSDDSYSKIKGAGFTDGEVLEIVGNVTLNIFTNFINHVAETESDFPKAPKI